MDTFSIFGNNPNPVKHRMETVPVFFPSSYHDFTSVISWSLTSILPIFIGSSDRQRNMECILPKLCSFGVGCSHSYWSVVCGEWRTSQFSEAVTRMSVSSIYTLESQNVFVCGLTQLNSDFFPSTGCVFSQGVCKSGLTVDWQMRWQVWRNGANHSGVINLLGALCL